MERKICTIVGNRPQFIKMAPVSAALSERRHKEYIIHTGQHFDDNMSNIFFEEMEIPKPNVTLGIKSSLHGGMTGEMLMQLESLLIEQKPSSVLLYGDTNSTLAAALAASKLHIPIAHVESGPRTYDIDTPEEINRITADHASALRFCPDMPSVQNLARENIFEGVYFTGDVMYDAFLKYSKKDDGSILRKLGVENKEFALLTCHRPNNTDTKEALKSLLTIVKESKLPVVFPMHPRTVNAFKKFDLYHELEECPNVILSSALGYVEILSLINKSTVVMTDSGGLQKEAYWAGKPTIIIFFLTPWEQIEKCGWQKICWKDNRIDVDMVIDLIENYRPMGVRPTFFGNGNAAKEIVDILEREGWL